MWNFLKEKKSLITPILVVAVIVLKNNLLKLGLSKFCDEDYELN